ncbi:MAG: hypothetical protein R3245_05380, partial [Kiloniellales bacterium]|nr:hypothetical protein [Kiloniellales bacterium]
QDRGPEPSRILANEYPGYFLKGLGRGLLGRPIPNTVFNLAISNPAFRAFAGLVYFHSRVPRMLPQFRKPYKLANKASNQTSEI